MPHMRWDKSSRRDIANAHKTTGDQRRKMVSEAQLYKIKTLSDKLEIKPPTVYTSVGAIHTINSLKKRLQRREVIE